jgi:flagellar basal-body rod protein FlgB
VARGLTSVVVVGDEVEGVRGRGESRRPWAMGMFIERLLDQGSAPLLEQTLRFTAARHRLIAENVVNVDTPNYRQKDLSVQKFHAMLRDRVDHRREAGPGDGRVGFGDVAGELESPQHGILFHDGNNRSMEHLMADQAKNAMMHNLVIELLRKQFQSLELALKERVG